MGRERKEISEVMIMFFILDKDFAFIGLFVHQNSANVHLRFVHFIVFEYYIKKT